MSFTLFVLADEYNSGVFAYGARMVLPAAVYEYDADDMFFTLYMNTWEEQEFDVEHNEYDSVYVYTSDGTEIDSNDPYDDFYMTYSKSAVEDEGKVGEDLLIGFDMYPDDSNIRFYVSNFYYHYKLAYYLRRDLYLVSYLEYNV